MEAITMVRTAVRKGVFITGGAAAAVLLAACGGGTADSAAPASQSGTSVVTTSVQEQASAVGAAGDAECKVADLGLSFGREEGAAGTTYRTLIFTNKGDRTCTMQGFPGVSNVAGDDGHQVGPAAERWGDKLASVTLEPGDSANVTIGFRNTLFTDDNCQQTEIRGLRIYPPHEYDSMFIAAGPGAVACAGPISDSQLTVTSVVPGTEPAN